MVAVMVMMVGVVVVEVAMIYKSHCTDAASNDCVHCRVTQIQNSDDTTASKTDTRTELFFKNAVKTSKSKPITLRKIIEIFTSIARRR